MLFDRFHTGVCYYPEHWPAEQHPRDLDRIAAAGFSYVRIGEGAWWYFEPMEGKYEFDLFDRVIRLCRERGLQVVFGTPTYAGPAWVSTNYPEVLRWDIRRLPQAHGSRRNFNYTSPKYLELSDNIVTALASHYRNDDTIIAWQLDNEFNCHSDVSYAPSDTIAFRRWLQKRYGDLEGLNAAWGTKFWSQVYSSFDQLDLPHPTATYHNPTQLLDETRFISDCVVEFAARQAEILRAHNANWLITHNGLFNNVNGRDLVNGKTTPPRSVSTEGAANAAPLLNFWSHDHYPLFWSDWTSPTFNLIQARSLSDPYAILEQQSGPGGQMSYLHRTPRPGEIRKWAFQTVAHGAQMLGYFCWQTCPFGSEQHWHGLLDADGEDTSRLAEVATLNAELAKLPRDFFESKLERQVAVLRDFDSDTNDRRINTFIANGAWETGRWTAELMRAHVPVDMIWLDSDWSGYRVIVAPHISVMTPTLVEKLTEFVQAGGTLVLGAQSGLHDGNLHITRRSPGLLSELAGVVVENWTTLPGDETRRALPPDGAEPIAMSTFVERLKPTTATVHSRWDDTDPLLANAPAWTINRVGGGTVHYLGGFLQNESIAQVLRSLTVTPVVEQLSPDVEVLSRIGKENRYLCVINHSAEATLMPPIGGETLLESSVSEHQLAPHGIVVIELK